VDARLPGTLRLRSTWLEPGELLLLVGLIAAVPVAAALAAIQPSLVILAVGALMLVAVTMARTDVAVLLLIATGPLESAFNTNSSVLSVTKVAGALAFVSFALYMVRSRRPMVLEPMQAVVLGILVIAFLSATQAGHLGVAVTTATRYASFVTLYFVISQLEPTPAFQRRVAWTFGIAATASAWIGLSRFLSGVDTRATLPYADPNDFAFMLAAALPLVFWLLGSRRLFLPIVVGMIGTLFAAIMLSFSRGTLLGLGVGLLFLIATDRRRLQLTIASLAIGTLAALIVIHSNPRQFHEALLQKQHIASQNVTTRFEAWSVASRLASDNPLLGIGPGNFRFHFDELAGLPTGTPGLAVAHDAYLDVAAELGIPAMLLFLVYLATTFARLTVSNRRGDGLPGYAQALRISLVVAMAGAVFLSEQYYLPFWLIGGLATAIWADGERRAEEDVPAAAPALV